ncbi:MAG: hypothetical protein ACYCOR_18840 [Acidobacteriaceae bacterium]
MIPDPSQPNVYGPITAGQMFERTFRLLRENFKLFFGIALILIGVHLVAAGIFGGSEFWMLRFNGGAPSVGRILLMFPIFLIDGILLFIFVLIIQGAFFIATQARLADSTMTVGEACNLAADKAGRLTGIALLILLRTIGYVLLFYIASVALALIVALMFGGLRHATGAVPFAFGHGASFGVVAIFVLLALVWIVVYVFFFFWLYARYALSVPAALAENLSVTESIRRSIHLSRGSKGRLYAMLLAIVGLYLVFDAVLLPIELMAFHTFHAPLSPPAIGAGVGVLFLLMSIVSIVMSTVVMAFIGVATALCYYDLRVRKEGFGVVASPPAAPAAPAESWPVPPDLPTGDLPIS